MMSQDGGKQSLKPGQLNGEKFEKFGEFPVSAPTFQIFTDAKSLVPLFNKASRKVPPSIERQILGMQHLDFTGFAYEACNHMCMPLHRPKTSDMLKKACLV